VHSVLSFFSSVRKNDRKHHAILSSEKILSAQDTFSDTCRETLYAAFGFTAPCKEKLAATLIFLFFHAATIIVTIHPRKLLNPVFICGIYLKNILSYWWAGVKWIVRE